MGTSMIGKKCSHDYKQPASLDSSYPLKKTEFFTSSNQTHDGLKQEPGSLISRLRQYPSLKPAFKREPLAPVRQSKFGRSFNSNSSRSSNLFSSRNRVNLPTGMGNLLNTHLEQAREAPIKPPLSPREADVKELFECNDDEVVEVVNVEEGKETSVVTVEDERNHDWKGGSIELDGKVVVNGHFQSPSVVTNIVSNENTRALSEARILDSGNMGLHAYKNLLIDVQWKYQHLEPLQFQIDFTEKKRQAQQQSRPPKNKQVDQVDVEAEARKKEMVSEAFKPLTNDEENQVARAFSSSQRRKHLIAHESSNIEITTEKIQCLEPGEWLNDEVINLYFELLKEREKREPQKFLKCHFFNTFFYNKLICSGRDGYNYQSVKRWTSQKKLGYCIFDCDKIFVPIHKSMHWCLAIINKKEQKFQYLDSLGHADSHVLKILARYFVDEVKDKSGKAIDVSSWTKERVEDLPEQENGFDCGVFMVKYADFYCRGIGLSFKQEHMPYFRNRTAKEILKLKAE